MLQRAVLPGLTVVLTIVPPNLPAGADTPENKFRTAVVELLGRFPVSEVPKQNLTEILGACHDILNHDHEDNGMVAQRVLFDIHKFFKNMLEEQSGPFFEWLKQVSITIITIWDEGSIAQCYNSTLTLFGFIH